MNREKNNYFKTKILEAVSDEKLLSHKDSVLVAVSGGADSVALVHIISELATDLDLTVAIAHFNHQLRGEDSDNDELFTEKLAEKLKLSFFKEKADVNAYGKKNRLGIEEAARHLRYEFLFKTADRHGFRKIATAHHADDNAELFLINLFRGSGSSGLGTMASKAYNGRVIRPLINIPKKDILSFIETNVIDFRTDLSNYDRSFLRNRIRHELLPLIEKNYQHGIGKILNRTAEIIKDDESYMEEITETVFQKAVVERSSSSITLDVSDLLKHHRAVLRRVVRKAMRHAKKDLKRITFLHTEKTVDLIYQNGSLRTLDFPGRLRVVRKDNVVVFRCEDGPLRQTPAIERHAMEDNEVEIPIPEPEGYSTRVPLGHSISGRFNFSIISSEKIKNIEKTGTETAFIDLSLLEFPLILRNTRSTDLFQPLGMTGRKKSPSKITMMHKNLSVSVPGHVLLSGKNIIWSCGYRIDDRFKCTPSTENVLKIELFLD